VTRVSTERVTCGMFVQLTWKSAELAWDDVARSYKFDGRNVGELGCEKCHFRGQILWCHVAQSWATTWHPSSLVGKW
jgi:hypothetical protein